jgi:hypothetical protein
MEYPKMLYKGNQYDDGNALYEALHGKDGKKGEIESKTVHDEDAEIIAREKGFMDFGALIKPSTESVTSIKRAGTAKAA